MCVVIFFVKSNQSVNKIRVFDSACGFSLFIGKMLILLALDFFFLLECLFICKKNTGNNKKKSELLDLI